MRSHVFQLWLFFCFGVYGAKSLGEREMCYFGKNTKLLTFNGNKIEADSLPQETKIRSVDSNQVRMHD